MVEALRVGVRPALEDALRDFERSSPGQDALVAAMAEQVRAVLASLRDLDVLSRDGGPVPTSLVRRLVLDAREHCAGAQALTAQSVQQIERSRRLAEDAARARRRSEHRRTSRPD